MKYQKGFTLIEIIFVVVVVPIIGLWIWNAAKLASCDFEPNYKCEVIHGIGLIIPPSSVVTAWFADDET